MYSERGFSGGTRAGVSTTSYQPAAAGSTGIRIATDSIIHVTSGLMDASNQMVLSYLHKAIKPLNQLRTLEDATVIYRISRAPERRIFYIDVGNLPNLFHKIILLFLRIGPLGLRYLHKDTINFPYYQIYF